jgi:hypothetical protein
MLDKDLNRVPLAIPSPVKKESPSVLGPLEIRQGYRNYPDPIAPEAEGFQDKLFFS